MPYLRVALSTPKPLFSDQFGNKWKLDLFRGQVKMVTWSATKLSGMFEIKLRSIRLPFKGGFYEVERRITQFVEFDIDMQLSSEHFIASGDISDTIDYSAIVPFIREVLKTENTLLESLAVAVSRRIMREFDVIRRVRVTVRKWPHLGCPHQGIEVSYTSGDQ